MRVSRYCLESALTPSQSPLIKSYYRVTYCVVLTYFFWECRISILLNFVHRMNSEDADLDGNAHMVIKVLMETLGLSLSALKSKCHHFTYDGIYCTFEERTTNNSLALTYFFSEIFGLEKGNITARRFRCIQT